MKSSLVVTVEPGQDVLQGFQGFDGQLFLLIGLPLLHVQLVFVGIGVLLELHSHIIQTLQGAHAGGAHGDGLRLMTDELLDGVPLHTVILRVHAVSFYLLTLHRLERTRTHMQGELLTVDTPLINSLEHIVGEVQTGGWGCHTTLDLTIDRLVGGLITLLRLAVQIRRNGQLASSIDDLGKRRCRRCRRCGVAPFEHYPMTRSLLAHARGGDLHLLTVQHDRSDEGSLFPFLQVSHQTDPFTPRGGLEHLLVVGRHIRLQQEHLDEGTRGFAEMHACLDHLGVVEHHEGSLRQV